MAESRISKKLFEVFATPEALLKSAEKAGFKDLKIERAATDIDWQEIAFARSLEVELADYKTSFAYLSKDYSKKSKLKELWGLLIVPPAFDVSILSAAKFVLRSSHTDALCDFIVRQLFPPEYSGQNYASFYKNCTIEEGAFVGPDCKFSEGCIIEAGARIGARVRVGEKTRIGAGTKVCDDTIIGSECSISANAVIGTQGFGLILYPNRHAASQRLHVGRVSIADRVRLGAFVAIDRGVFEDSFIGSDVAMDNHIQIGHNCQIGAGSILCAFSGLSGSTILEERVTFAGMVTTKGHLKVGKGATIGGHSGLTRDVNAGETLKGYPALPVQETLKIQTLTRKLPELYERIKVLEKQIKLSNDQEKDNVE